MTEKYLPQEIEPKWQETWEANGLYKTVGRPGSAEALCPNDAALSVR